MRLVKVLGVAALVSVSGLANAASVGTLGVEFEPGDGNSNENFVIDLNSELGIEVGVKAKERFVGDLPVSGTTYQAPVGSPDDDGLASWNFEWSFDLGTNDPSNYSLLLAIDFDPSDDEEFLLLPTPADSPTAAFQGSQNLGFGFWSLFAPAGSTVATLINDFDPNKNGRYGFYAEVLDLQGTSVARAAGDVLVTPLPAAAWLFLSAVGGLAGFKRFARRQAV